MIVKVLVEDTPVEGLCTEHGLCFYVEYNDKKYLIDAGASSCFASNAKMMDIDLATINMAFLSHAHYDHSGGFKEFFKLNNKASVYLQTAAKYQKCYKIIDSNKKYIGIENDILNRFDERFVYIDNATMIDDGVYVIPHNSNNLIERSKHTHLYVETNGLIQLDNFAHEQSIVFKQANDLICFNSCSHAGVDIIIEEIKHHFPKNNLKAYFGGFHMMAADGISTCSYNESQVKEIAYKLKKTCDTKFFSGHCTGIIASKWLKDVLGDRFESIQTGSVINI